MQPKEPPKETPKVDPPKISKEPRFIFKKYKPKKSFGSTTDDRR